MENKDDNGRCEGTFDSLTAEHIISHFQYGEKSGSDITKIEKETQSE